MDQVDLVIADDDRWCLARHIGARYRTSTSPVLGWHGNSLSSSFLVAPASSTQGGKTHTDLRRWGREQRVKAMSWRVGSG